MHGLKGLDLQTYRDLNWDRHPMARGSGASKAAKLKRAGARGRGMPQAAKLEVEHGLTNKNCGCPCKLWFDCKNLGFNKKMCAFNQHDDGLTSKFWELNR